MEYCSKGILLASNLYRRPWKIYQEPERPQLAREHHLEILYPNLPWAPVHPLQEHIAPGHQNHKRVSYRQRWDPDRRPRRGQGDKRSLLVCTDNCRDSLLPIPRALRGETLQWKIGHLGIGLRPIRALRGQAAIQGGKPSGLGSENHQREIRFHPINLQQKFVRNHRSMFNERLQETAIGKFYPSAHRYFPIIYKTVRCYGQSQESRA